MAAEGGAQTTIMMDATYLKAHRTASSLRVELRAEASALKEVVADLTLENRLLKTYGPPRWQVGCC